MEQIYSLTITLCLVMAMAHLGVVFSYRNRVSPWHSKIVFAIGILVALTWLHFRAWEGVARSWIGVGALWFFLLSFFYYTVHYRLSAFRMKEKSPKRGENDGA